MRLKSSSKNQYETIILNILFLYICILRWFNLTSVLNYILCALIIIHILLNLNQYLKMGSTFASVLVILYMALNYIIINNDIMILVYNMYQIATPLLVLLFFTYLATYMKHYILCYLFNHWLILNSYLIVNLMVSLLQLNGHYWLAGLTDSVNTLKVDLISGLFGFNGIPIETVFCSFVIVFNILYIKQCNDTFTKSIAGITNFILMVSYTLLSFVNDNKAFIPIIGISVFGYFICYIYNKNLSTISNFKFGDTLLYIIPVLIMSVALFCILYFFTPFNSLVDKLVHEVQIGYTSMNSVQGSNERVGMISYALSSGNNLLFGFGVSLFTWTTPGAFGFIHFGQSDLGAFLCLGGLAMIILYIFLIYSVLSTFISHRLLRVFGVLFFLMLSVYTQILTVPVLMASSFLLIFAIFARSTFNEDEFCSLPRGLQ